MKRAFAYIVSATIAACAREPVRPPSLPTAERYTPTPVAQRTASADVHGGQAQQLVQGKDIPAQWWGLFHCAALDALLNQALSGSPSLARARARLTQAREQLSARSGATQYPHVGGNLGANRVQVQPDSLDAPQLPVEMPLNLLLASVSVSYTLDIFGASRRELDALRAEVDYQQFELEAAQLMLAGNVVTAAIREASLREQLASAQEIVALEERQLAIAERMQQLGTVAEVDVVAQRLALARSRAVLPDLSRQLEQLRHRIAVYIGQPPGTAQLPEFRLAQLELPSELPLSLPSELARQRPDIRAAEALLYQASARVGVATANLYPQFNLSANVGSLATAASNWFTLGTGFYLLGAQLTQPLFRGGELRAKRRAAIAAYEQAGAAYKEVVLQGLQNVADVLRALEADAEKLEQRAEAAKHARKYYEIAAARYEAGALSHYSLLVAQQELEGALREQTQAVADRYADSAALLQALGGGWWQSH
jgi:NodT family efflux transporter outer membrane factor (OMF) lipoprotein